MLSLHIGQASFPANAVKVHEKGVRGAATVLYIKYCYSTDLLQDVEGYRLSYSKKDGRHAIIIIFTSGRRNIFRDVKKKVI